MSLRISGLSQSFGDLEVLRDISLSVKSGEFAAIVGPSGSGKSTLFNVITGLEQPTSGTIEADAAAYMPQKDLLFPWRTVLANTALGLEATGTRKKAARAKANELFAAFGLDGFQNSYPRQLSGGMRQRAALLRTVVLDRPLLLLDEPFGALDSLTRTEMQLWLADVWQRFGWTVVLVTHDIREAVLLADTVHVLSPRPGRIIESVPVDLKRPRSTDDFAAADFTALEQRVLRALRRGAPEETTT